LARGANIRAYWKIIRWLNLWCGISSEQGKSGNQGKVRKLYYLANIGGIFGKFPKKNILKNRFLYEKLNVTN